METKPHLDSLKVCNIWEHQSFFSEQLDVLLTCSSLTGDCEVEASPPGCPWGRGHVPSSKEDEEQPLEALESEHLLQQVSLLAGRVAG